MCVVSGNVDINGGLDTHSPSGEIETKALLMGGGVQEKLKQFCFERYRSGASSCRKTWRKAAGPPPPLYCGMLQCRWVKREKTSPQE